ncbi:cupin domain-containing protein [Sphingobacterium faecium]|uniref:cupin domain-containing protein n=1 Tax=Sphingobacterium faecium TaxID=34087 RepID=UPI00320919D1
MEAIRQCLVKVKKGEILIKITKMKGISLINDKEGVIFHIAKGQYRTIISGRDTDGKYAIIEMNVPPGAGPFPHAHKNTEEVFYVANGEVDFRTKEGTFKAKAGDTIKIPLGGEVHSFKNTSQKDVKLICTVYPAGFDEMFEEINASDSSKAIEIGEKYGNQFLPEDYFGK